MTSVLCLQVPFLGHIPQRIARHILFPIEAFLLCAGAIAYVYEVRMLSLYAPQQLPLPAGTAWTHVLPRIGVLCVVGLALCAWLDGVFSSPAPSRPQPEAECQDGAGDLPATSASAGIEDASQVAEGASSCAAGAAAPMFGRAGSSLPTSSPEWQAAAAPNLPHVNVQSRPGAHSVQNAHNAAQMLAAAVPMLREP